VRVYGPVALFTVLGAALLVVANTILLAVYARRDEIEIMRLVGATDGYVRAPFLLEGALQGLIGAALALGAVVALQKWLLPGATQAFAFAAGIRAPPLSPAYGAGLLGSLTSVTGDREIAYTSLFARLVLKGHVALTREEIRRAERAIVTYRFGGSGAAYRRALARAGASPDIARGVIADELRQAKTERHFRVSSPTVAEIAERMA